MKEVTDEFDLAVETEFNKDLARKKEERKQLSKNKANKTQNEETK